MAKLRVGRVEFSLELRLCYVNSWMGGNRDSARIRTRAIALQPAEPNHHRGIAICWRRLLAQSDRSSPGEHGKVRTHAGSPVDGFFPIRRHIARVPPTVLFVLTPSQNGSNLTPAIGRGSI